MAATCVLVTGANRGLGKAICLALAPKLKSGSVLVLFGRSKESLAETKAAVIATTPALKVLSYYKFECANLNEEHLRNFISESMPDFSDVDELLLIHNAGTVGDPSQTALNINLQTASEYMSINVSSMISLNSVIMQMLASMKSKTIVNITSLAAVSAIKGLSLYSAGKACRDIFFKVVAAENPSVRVLNYAPGPLDTAMFHCIRDTCHDAEVKATFEGMTPLKVEDSANRLVQLLTENKFTSGDHVDYFDQIG